MGICDEAVFHRIFIENAQALRNAMYYKCGDMALAEDLAQESFVRMWNRCKDVGLGKAKAFLFKVANNLFLDHVKHNKVKLRFKQYVQPQSQVDKETPEHIYEQQEFKEKLEAAISSLPVGQREVFLLNRIDQLTYREIAERLGISQKAVEKRMSAALAKLRKLYSKI